MSKSKERAGNPFAEKKRLEKQQKEGADKWVPFSYLSAAEGWTYVQTLQNIHRHVPRADYNGDWVLKSAIDKIFLGRDAAADVSVLKRRA